MQNADINSCAISDVDFTRRRLEEEYGTTCSGRNDCIVLRRISHEYQCTCYFTDKSTGRAFFSVTTEYPTCTQLLYSQILVQDWIEFVLCLCSTMPKSRSYASSPKVKHKHNRSCHCWAVIFDLKWKSGFWMNVSKLPNIIGA